MDNSYVPKLTATPTEVLPKILTQANNSPYWHIPRHCPHCNKNNIRYTKLHRILECDRHKGKRKHIFDSKLTELNYLKQKFYGTEHANKLIIPREQYHQIQDAATTGNMHTIQTQQQILTTLLGGNVDVTLKDTVTHQMTRTMVAHLYLLINILTNNICETINWTELPDGTIVAEEDVKQRKMQHER